MKIDTLSRLFFSGSSKIVNPETTQTQQEKSTTLTEVSLKFDAVKVTNSIPSNDVSASDPKVQQLKEQVQSGNYRQPDSTTLAKSIIDELGL